MRRNKKQETRKASHTYMARALCSLYGVKDNSDLDVVLDALTTVDAPRPLVFASVLYAWETDVAREIMSDKDTPLILDLFETPGTVYLVKDSRLSGKDGLWLCACNPPAEFVRSLSMAPHKLVMSSRSVRGAACEFWAVKISSLKTSWDE
jgi:hypothetical protein